MDIALWVVQALLALANLFAGGTKLAQAKDALAQRGMAYVEDLTSTQVKLIGVAEVLGALGLILPQATGIVPVLTPVAAIGVAIVQAGAVVTHVRRKEPQAIVVNLLLIGLAVFVAVGRFVA